ncbi:MAG: hypothetical protein HY903_00935 [Deltaproteobacteria bacterium]|nr:hypothetical protein [Deltaproteobacteria bacterium]
MATASAPYHLQRPALGAVMLGLAAVVGCGANGSGGPRKVDAPAGVDYPSDAPRPGDAPRGDLDGGDRGHGGDIGAGCQCDDGNPCTRDSCLAGQCQRDAMPVGVVTCIDATSARVCTAAGALATQSCGARCEALGFNGVLGCSNDACGCTNLGGACTVGREACVSPDGVTQYRAVCVDNTVLGTAGPIWQVAACDRICAASGYGVAVGCTADPLNATRRVCVCGHPCSPPCTGTEVCDWRSGSCYSSASPECDFNSDCPSHMICSSQRCLYVDCTSDSNCPYCFRCSGYACVSCGDNPYGGCGC